jgi:membrane protein DedA with SNARE-associated domain
MPISLGLIASLIASYGYGLVFLVVMAESAGLPVPGETSLLLAAAFAATGQLAIGGVIAAAALGAILGDTAGYWIGRRYGLVFIRRHGRLFHFDEKKRLKAEAFFARHGEKTVFIGRFIPVGRIFSAVLAGAARMHYRRFLFWNAAGGIVWASLVGTLGYVFGQHLPLIERVLRQSGLALLVLVIAVIAARVALRQRARLGAAARRARAALARGVASLLLATRGAPRSVCVAHLWGALGALIVICAVSLALVLT